MERDAACHSMMEVDGISSAPVIRQHEVMAFSIRLEVMLSLKKPVTDREIIEGDLAAVGATK